MHRFSLGLVVLLLLFANGCSDRPSSSSTTSNASSDIRPSNSTDSERDPSLSENIASSDSKNADRNPSNAARQVNSAQEASAPITQSTQGPVSSKSNAKSKATAKQPPKATAIKPPATPTADQIANWAIPDYQPLQLLACYDGFGDSLIDAMAIGPDGKRFALGGVHLTLWNTTDSKPIVDLIADYKGDDIERPIRSVAFSPDGNWLAAGDQKGMLRIWSVSDQSQVVAIRAHDARLTQLAFSPDSSVLATTSYSGEVRLWQTSDGKKIKSLKMSEHEVSGLVFLSDQLVATVGGEANVWNVESEKKEAVLTTGYVIGPALGLSNDRRMFAFSDSESKIQFWDIEQRAISKTGVLLGGASGSIAFSNDGKWIAAQSSDSTLRIWDAASRQTVQVIDADGDRTTDLAWLPQSRMLIVASEQGRLRIWGSPDEAESIGLTPLQLPELRSIAVESRRSLNSAQLKKVIDIRSFPRLPGAIPQWDQFFMAGYSAPSSQADAEMFYRHYLGKAGWEDVNATQSFLPGMIFRKEGCELHVAFNQSSAPGSADKGEVQVSLNFSGNYDVRWLPKFAAIDSKNVYESFSSSGYRTKADLTDVEVGLLKDFHEAGWSGYTRLASSSTEDPNSRTFYMLQGGSGLTVSIGHPADSADELFVQTSVSVSNKSLPIPPDAGWIEFDASTNLQLVANTDMDLNKSVEYFDSEMTAEGWLTREVGRKIDLKDRKAWLPYIRGQQDVLIRLVSLPDGKTRVIVGEAERSSWQLAKPTKMDPETEKNGIEAADFPIVARAGAIKFDVDEKQIHFELPDVLPPALADQYAKRLGALEWEREKSGVVSDEYTLATYKKGKAEIQLRARLSDSKNSSVIISGDGMLWAKPLPAPPVRSFLRNLAAP